MSIYLSWLRYYEGRNLPTGCSLHLAALWTQHVLGEEPQP